MSASAWSTPRSALWRPTPGASSWHCPGRSVSGCSVKRDETRRAEMGGVMAGRLFNADVSERSAGPSDTCRQRSGQGCNRSSEYGGKHHMIYLEFKDIETVDDAIELLQMAIALEFSTLPPYLYALYSIRPGTNAAAFERIRFVAMEEMVHMC